MRDDLIRAVFGCGKDDLSMLDDAGADMYKIVGHMREKRMDITLNSIMGEVLKEGIRMLDEEVESLRKELENEEQGGRMTESGHE